jgi:hypothetical protein
MNSLTVKILAVLVSVLMLTTICTQIRYAVRDRHDTEEAVLATVNEDVVFSGVVVRDETVVTYDGDGIIDYDCTDGGKVSVGNSIAEVYSSESEINAKNRIAEIESEISNLERAQNPGTTNYVEPESLRRKIEREYQEMLDCLADGDYEELEDVKSELSLNMNIYDIVTGKESDYEDRLKELQQELSELKSESATASKVITAEKTGYFVSYADGYEKTLTTENIANLTEDDINSVINGEAHAPDNAIGKMLDSYVCKIVGVVDADSRIAEDTELSLMLNTSKNVYDVTVESVTPCNEDESRAIVVLSCDRIDENLVESRVLSAKLIFEEYQGIKVPRSALRFQGDQKGVYVILGKDISFKKVDVIYEGDDFILSSNTSDEDYLLLYDQILLEVVSSKDVSSSESDEA